MKDSFVLFTELIDTVSMMDNEHAGELFKMILNYEADRDPADGIEDCSNESMIAFSFVKRQLDKLDEKYQETVERRKKAGQAGANARWQTHATACDRITENGNRINRNADECEPMAKMADTDTVTDTDTVYPTDIKEEKCKRFTPPTAEQVKEYCQERNNNVDPETFVDFYASKGWKVGNNPMKDWKACVRTWEKRERGSPQKKPFNITSYLLDQIQEGDEE